MIIKKFCLIITIFSIFIFFATMQEIHSQEQNDIKEDQFSEEIGHMRKVLNKVKENKEALDKYNEESEHIRQLIDLFDELDWIIQKNAAYIKDWKDNYNCLVGQRASEILSKDIERIQRQLSKIKGECQQVSLTNSPNLYKLCNKKVASLNDTIQSYNLVKSEFLERCKK